MARGVKKLSAEEIHIENLKQQIHWGWQPPDMREKVGSYRGGTSLNGKTGVTIGSGFKSVTIVLKNRGNQD
jgi:hypothetical protein